MDVERANEGTEQMEILFKITTTQIAAGIVFFALRHFGIV